MGTAAAMVVVARRAERRATPGRAETRREPRDATGLARLEASAGGRIVAGKDATGDMSNERRTGVAPVMVSLPIRGLALCSDKATGDRQPKLKSGEKREERALSLLYPTELA